VLLAALLDGRPPDQALESLYQRWRACSGVPPLPDCAEIPHA
jgi:hypothetical protein